MMLYTDPEKFVPGSTLIFLDVTILGNDRDGCETEMRSTLIPVGYEEHLEMGSWLSRSNPGRTGIVIPENLVTPRTP